MIRTKITALTMLFAFITAPFAIAMDRVRLETRTDLAVEKFQATGEGVIVAIIDRGIDWKSNDFRNDDGTTRIKYIFDLTDDTGSSAPGNPYNMGTIYTEAQINSALTNGTSLATRDAVGHGTSTTGIAAGNGSNLPDRRYRGIAPKASIIAVKFTSEGAPAHDGQPAEAPYYVESRITNAIDFVRAKSVELNMPAVMLANFGTVNGPTDGTSFLARTIDAAVGPGKPGLIFVTGTGDDGGMPNRVKGTIAQGNTASIRIEKNTAGTLRADLWYAGTDRFNFSITTPSGQTFGPFTPPDDNGDDYSGTGFAAYHRAGGSVFYGATNGKRELMVDISGANGIYTLNLIGASVTNGRFDGTLNPSRIPSLNNRFLDYVFDGSIIDQATAHNNIAPNSYVGATTWTDIDGVSQQIEGQGEVGELWLGSSTGLSFDDRSIVDLSAPGDLVITSYGATSYWATFRSNLVLGGNGLYGRAGAVSAAAPQVTGLIALMLEKNPGLDAPSVKALLRRSSRPDAFTGAVPNPTWGHGKMDSYNALQLATSKISLSGRVNDLNGRGLARAFVTITDALGTTRILRTNTFGNFIATDLPIGRDYTIAAASSRYSHASLTVAADESVSGISIDTAPPTFKSKQATVK